MARPHQTTRVRRGFALLVAMVCTVLAATLGLSYLASNGHALPQALNVAAAARAKAMAASGVAMATHYLSNPPTSVAVGNYWTGATHVSPDGGTDYFDVTVVRVAAAPSQFDVTATGVAANADASIAAKKTISTRILTPPPYTWALTRAATFSATPTLSDTVRFLGNIHANGSITSAAYCSGAVSATGTITWTNATPPASKTSGAAAAAMPTLTGTMWDRYVLHGTPYAAQSYSSIALKSTTVEAMPGGKSSLTVVYGSRIVYLVDPLGALTSPPTVVDGVAGVQSNLGLVGTTRWGPSVISPQNPGGVLVTTGDLDLNAGAVGFVGTLVVNGRLRVRAGAFGYFSAMPGFPSLVVTGDIEIDDNVTVEARGPVLLGGKLVGTKPDFTSYSPVQFYGSAIKSDFGKTGTADFRWASNYQNYYDFTSSVIQPMTLLSWAE